MQEDFRLLEQRWELGLAEREAQKEIAAKVGQELTSEDAHWSVNHTFNASNLCLETHLSCKPAER